MDKILHRSTNEKRTLNRLFIGLIGLVELIILLIMGLSFTKMLSGEISIFSLVALNLVLLWLGIIVGYLAWAIYFYNINRGLTNESWAALKAEKIKREKMRDAGLAECGDTNENFPQENVYKDESLGLPSGTVRATLTLTLMVGALSLFIYSMGDSQIREGDSFIYDSFEFFKTAFLMMIAFYFGSRSLEILRPKDAIKNKPFNKGAGAASPETGSPLSTETDEITAPENVSKESEFSLPKQGLTATTGMKSPLSHLSGLKQVLKEKKQTLPTEVEQEVSKAVETESSIKLLTTNEIIATAKSNNIDPAALLAVTAVESGKSGFLTDGRPKILFEGHKFWKNLKDFQQNGKIDFGPEKFAADYPEILYPSWTKKYYVGGSGEYTRLDKAILIHRDSALMATSWGKFQILGENYTLAGFEIGRAHV